MTETHPSHPFSQPPPPSHPLDKAGLTRRAGFALEREFYSSPGIFEQDVERIYLRHWLFAGHVSRLPRNGDFFLYCVADESVIIVREQKEMGLR